MAVDVATMEIESRQLMNAWLARPWPTALGNNCLIVNTWGLWAIIDGVKCGPYQSEKHLCDQLWAADPEWVGVHVLGMRHVPR